MKQFFPALAFVALVVPAANAGIAPVLLELDISDPANVVVSATGAAPITDDSSTSSVGGVQLLGVYTTGGSQNSSTLTSDLVAHGVSVPGAYNSLYSDLFGAGPLDIGFWANSVTIETQDFTLSASAFTGSLTFASDPTFVFAAPGTSGVIRSGDVFTPGVVIGSWLIVPAPGALALFGTAALAGVRRRR